MPSTKCLAPSQKSSQKIKKSQISSPTDTEDNGNDSEDKDSKDEEKGRGNGEDEKELQEEDPKKKDKVEWVVFVQYVPFSYLFEANLFQKNEAGYL